MSDNENENDESSLLINKNEAGDDSKISKRS